MRRVVGLIVLGTGLAACTRDQTVGLDPSPDPAAAGPADAGGVPGFVLPPAPPRAPGGHSCRLVTALDGEPGRCNRQAPPRTFAPVLKWSWSEPAPPPGATTGGSLVVPLVANLTDDDGDGRVDLCDVPDVVVVTRRRLGSGPWIGGIAVLGGSDGALEFEVDPGPQHRIAPHVTPALGDLDGDGLPELVTVDPGDRKLLIFDHRGRLARVGEDPVAGPGAGALCSALALYDLDADGAPEIIFGATDVFDRLGRRRFGNDFSLWFASALLPSATCLTAAAADLDGDGRLEVVLGNAAFRPDGTRLWSLPDAEPGHPHVANFDEDPQPEILLSRVSGTLLLEHDGAVKFRSARQPSYCVAKPSAIHELDGRGLVDAAGVSCGRFQLLELQPSGLRPYVSIPVIDRAAASSTAFDFLGRGHAQAVYSDWDAFYAFDGKTGAVELALPSSPAGELLTYPVVADVDDDGSADVVVVQGRTRQTRLPGELPGVFPPDPVEVPPAHTVQVFEDREQRWMATRRIWNQHAYHVTNVREDGTIPRVPERHWLGRNSFRSNAPLAPAASCPGPTVE